MKLRVACGALATIGLGIAAYLTIVHYTGSSPVCAISHGCETVQKSRYSEVAGVPVALLGLLGYAAILLTLLRDDEAARIATAVLALAGLAFSAWLTYAEIALIHAICIWCVASAIVLALLTGLSAVRMLAAPVSVPSSSTPRATT